MHVDQEQLNLFMDRDDWAMFTRKGNKRVLNIFRMTFKIDRKYSEAYFKFASDKLTKLSEKEEFGEAMDSEVRRTLYGRIEALLRVSNILKFGESYSDYVY